MDAGRDTPERPRLRIDKRPQIVHDVRMHIFPLLDTHPRSRPQARPQVSSLTASIFAALRFVFGVSSSRRRTGRYAGRRQAKNETYEKRSTPLTTSSRISGNPRYADCPRPARIAKVRVTILQRFLYMPEAIIAGRADCPRAQRLLHMPEAILAGRVASWATMPARKRYALTPEAKSAGRVVSWATMLDPALDFTGGRVGCTATV